MLQIVCDSCKKAIPGQEKETGIVYIADKTLCRACEGKLESKVREAMAKHDKYNLRIYKSNYEKILNQMCK